MSAMSESVAELRTAFENIGLTVLENPINVSTGWCVVIVDNDPSLTNINTVGTNAVFTYGVTIHFVGGNPTTSFNQLRDMVEDGILALGPTNWISGDASAPFNGDGGDGKVFLTVSLPVRQIIEITGGQ